MAPLFECVLEPSLKGTFIRRSDSTEDNRGMKPVRAIASARPVGTAARMRDLAVAALLGVAVLSAAWAGDHDDHERARAAVRAGEVLPLPALMERLQRTHPGRVLELELEREDDRWIYDIKLLQADGRLVKLEVDARTAEVLDVKRKRARKSDPQERPR